MHILRHCCRLPALHVDISGLWGMVCPHLQVIMMANMPGGETMALPDYALLHRLPLELGISVQYVWWAAMRAVHSWLWSALAAGSRMRDAMAYALLGLIALPPCHCRYDINCRYQAHFNKFLPAYVAGLPADDRQQLESSLARLEGGKMQFVLPAFHQKMHRSAVGTRSCANHPRVRTCC